MRAKIRLSRAVGWTASRGSNAAAKHPLGALFVAACFDESPTNLPPVGVYTRLNAMSLPGGGGVLPSHPANYAIQGLCIVGPQGALPFTVLSAQHRYTADCQYQTPVQFPGIPPSLTFNKVNVLNSGLWKRNVLDFYNAQIVTQSIYGSLTGGSVFRFNNNVAIVPEDNSFVTDNATFIDSPGYTTKSRFSDAESVPGMLATVNESIRYRQQAQGLGRFMSIDASMLNFTAMELHYQTTILGASVQHNCGGTVQSVWDIEIDDNLVNQAASLQGAIYAIASGAVPSAWFGVESFINTSSGTNIEILGKPNATPYFDAGNPDYLYVNLSRPLSTSPVAQNTQNISLYDQVGGADLGVPTPVVSQLSLQAVSDVGVSIIS